MDDLDRVSIRLKNYGDGPNTGIITVHMKKKPREFIDIMVLKGYYMTRSEFIRMAIDQKIEKVIAQLNDPFYQELMVE